MTRIRSSTQVHQIVRPYAITFIDRRWSKFSRSCCRAVRQVPQARIKIRIDLR
jgi:hypothetical protein